MNKDTVVGILGAVILVAAMVGIFYYEGTQAPGAVGGGGPGGAGGAGGAFRTANATGPGDSGQLAAGASEDLSVNITRANLTAVEFRLEWTDENIPQNTPDEFRLAVTSPGGVTLEATGAQSPVTVRFSPLNEVPTGAAAAPGTVGTGTWRVTVELVSVGQPGGLPLPGQVPVSDQGNAWTLASALSYYERA